jgi:hypothetical protein
MMRSIHRILWLPIVAVVALGWGHSVRAQSVVPSQDFLNERIFVDVALFITGTRIREIDFNHEFGAGSDTSQFRVEGLWRITPRDYGLAYELAFIRRPVFELASSFGIYFTKADLGLSGIASLTTAAGARTTTFASKEITGCSAGCSPLTSATANFTALGPIFERD